MGENNKILYNLVHSNECQLQDHLEESVLPDAQKI